MKFIQKIKNIFHKQEVYRLTPQYILAIALSKTICYGRDPSDLFKDEDFNKCWDIFEEIMKTSGYIK